MMNQTAQGWMVSGDSHWEHNRQTVQAEVSVVSHVSEVATRHVDTKATVKVDRIIPLHLSHLVINIMLQVIQNMRPIYTSYNTHVFAISYNVEYYDATFDLSLVYLIGQAFQLSVNYPSEVSETSALSCEWFVFFDRALQPSAVRVSDTAQGKRGR